MLENTRYLLSMSPMLILDGLVAPTYDKVRIYSLALSHAEIITSANEGVNKVPETGKEK